MKRFLIPLLAAVALPTVVNANENNGKLLEYKKEDFLAWLEKRMGKYGYTPENAPDTYSKAYKSGNPAWAQKGSKNNITVRIKGFT